MVLGSGVLIVPHINPKRFGSYGTLCFAMARCGTVRLGLVRYVPLRFGSFGMFRHGGLWYGYVGYGSYVMSSWGEVRCSLAWFGSFGGSCYGRVLYGLVRFVGIRQLG